MKRRIMLGLLPLLALLIFIGGYAVILFSRLGGAVDVILRENYRSVVAAQNIKEAVERLDSGLFFTLAGEEERGRKLYRQNVPILVANLEAEQRNITVPGEAELARELTELHRQVLQGSESFLGEPEAAVRRRRYFDEMLPLFTRLKDTAGKVLELNQERMVSADREARRLAAESTRYLILAVLLGTGLGLAWMINLVRSVLRPVQAVTAGAVELGAGNYDQVVPVPTRDELGQLAETFNKLAGKLREYRRHTDEKLLRARAATESTFSALPDPVLVLAEGGAIEFQNPAAVRLLQKLEEHRLPARVMDLARGVLQGGADYLPENFEQVVLVRVEERETFLLPRVIGLGQAAGEEGPRAAVILQDVTRFRLLDDVKTNLIATVSHELKTPLTSIRMGLHLVLEERIGSLNAQQTELMLAAREDAERLLRMINDLLDLARLESGTAALPLVPVPAAEIVREAQREGEIWAELYGVRWRCEIEPELPKVRVESQRIAHVLANFLSNAAKHSPRGEEIVLRAERAGEGMVRFSVSDHGLGVPREFQARIFDRFFRVPGTTKEGAGLGLAIAREIVVAHQGHVGVESAPGQGSVFYFVLPAA